MFITPFITPRSFDAVVRWPVRSQQRSRRNAMIASTRLAQRRAELVEVEEYLTSVTLGTNRDITQDIKLDTPRDGEAVRA